MSAYTSDGRRRSSMTHARKGHKCELPTCDAVSYGNGGVVSHGRGHVRRGEAVELVKAHGRDGYAYPSPVRTFVDVKDVERIEQFRSRGFEQVTTP